MCFRGNFLKIALCFPEEESCRDELHATWSPWVWDSHDEKKGGWELLCFSSTDVSHCLTAVLQGWNSTFNPMAFSSVTWLLLISKNKDPQALNRLLSHRSYLDVQSDAHVFVWRFDDFSSGSFCKHLVDIYVLITMLESCIWLGFVWF